jgi:hypothetical protein
MVKRRSLVVLALLLAVLTTVGGAASVTGEVGFSDLIAVDREGTFANTFSPTIQLTLASSQTNVRGDIRIHVPPASNGSSWDDYIGRAYLRARFPFGRLTVGKNALSWGDGFFFNAAEVVTRGFDQYQALLRPDALWLAALYVPIASFNFVEVVALPSLLDSDVGIAGRLYVSLGSLKAEAGYVYRESLHTPYVSLQGHLGLDWWLSSSLDITSKVEELRLSAGLFHSFFLIDGGTITLRGEAMALPIGQERGLCVGIEGAYAPDQSQRFSLSATYSTSHEVLGIGAGYRIIPLEALTIGAALHATCASWSFEQTGLTLSCSWIF